MAKKVELTSSYGDWTVSTIYDGERVSVKFERFQTTPEQGGVNIHCRDYVVSIGSEGEHVSGAIVIEGVPYPWAKVPEKKRKWYQKWLRESKTTPEQAENVSGV